MVALHTPVASGYPAVSELHQVFSEYYGTRELMVDINRVVSGRRAIGIGQREPGRDSLGHRSEDRRRGSLQSIVLLSELGATPVDCSVCPTFIRTWKPGLLSTRSARISILQPRPKRPQDTPN